MITKEFFWIKNFIKMSDISSDEDNAMVRLEDIPKIKPGMFVSGW